MTGAKCEHESIGTIRFGKEPLEHYCAHCRVRFVPSDVLEEAREALGEISRDAFLEILVNARANGPGEAFAKAKAALHRIDEVLGK